MLPIERLKHSINVIYSGIQRSLCSGSLDIFFFIKIFTRFISIMCVHSHSLQTWHNWHMSYFKAEETKNGINVPMHQLNPCLQGDGPIASPLDCHHYLNSNIDFKDFQMHILCIFVSATRICANASSWNIHETDYYSYGS